MKIFHLIGSDSLLYSGTPYFPYCLCVALLDSMSDSAATLLFQWVLVGKAQQAYAALSPTDCQVNVCLRQIGTAEGLCASSREEVRVDFVCDLVSQINRWCSIESFICESVAILCHI